MSGRRDRPRRRPDLSQHFLRSRRLAASLIASAPVGTEDLVVEIGPGRGILTAELARRAREVRGVELDAHLCGELRQRFRRHPNVSIAQKDFLRYALPREGAYKVVGNIPYNRNRGDRRTAGGCLATSRGHLPDRAAGSGGAVRWHALRARVRGIATPQTVVAGGDRPQARALRFPAGATCGLGGDLDGPQTPAAGDGSRCLRVPRLRRLLVRALRQYRRAMPSRYLYASADPPPGW